MNKHEDNLKMISLIDDMPTKTNIKSNDVEVLGIENINRSQLTCFKFNK